MGVPWLLVAIIGVVIVILGWLLFRGGMAVGGPGPGAKPGQGGAAAPPPQPTRPDPVAVHNAVDALTGRIEDGTFPGSVAEAIDELDALKGQVDAVGRAAWTMGVGTDAGSAAADDRARLDAAIARAKTWVYPTPPPSDILSPSEVDQWNRDQRLIPGSDAYKAAQATWRAKAADVANVAAEAKSVAGSGAAPEVREFAATAEARASALGEAVAKVFP